MNRKLISVFFGFVILIISFLISNLIINKDVESYNKNTIITHSINTIEIKNKLNPISVRVNGNLKAKYKIDLYSEVQGNLKRSKKEFRSGQYYNDGEVLIHIDSKEFLARVKQSRSELQNLIAQSIPNIKLDFPENFNEWEFYFKNYDINSNIKPLPKNKSDKEKFYIVGVGLLSKYYSVKNLEERLKKYAILSPFNGTLVNTYVNEGSLVMVGQKLGTYINSNNYELEVSVPSKYADMLVIGEEVKLLSAHPKNLVGKVSRINNSIDSESQSFRVFVEFESNELKDGMYCEIEIPLGSVSDSFSLSRSLLINDSYVYYVKDNMTVGLQNVEPVFYDDQNVVVTGLKNGLQILKTYIPGIYDGMKVKIVN